MPRPQAHSQPSMFHAETLKSWEHTAETLVRLGSTPDRSGHEAGSNCLLVTDSDHWSWSLILRLRETSALVFEDSWCTRSLHSVRGFILAIFHDLGRDDNTSRDESDSSEQTCPSVYTDTGKLSLKDLKVTSSRGIDTNKACFFFHCLLRSPFLRWLSRNFLPPIVLWSVCSKDSISYTVPSDAHLACACNKTPPKGLQNTQNVHNNVTGKVQSPHKAQLLLATSLTPPSRQSYENLSYTKMKHTMQ